MGYKTSSIKNIRTIKALRGESLTIDLGATQLGTLEAWMKKTPNSATYRSFDIVDNRYLFLTQDKASDYLDISGDVIEAVGGRWDFDVEQVLDGQGPEDVKTIFRGTILFQNDITNSSGFEILDPITGPTFISLGDTPSVYEDPFQYVRVNSNSDGLIFVDPEFTNQEVTDIKSHLTDTDNPHSTTLQQVTDAGATTTTDVQFTGEIRTTTGTSERLGNNALSSGLGVDNVAVGNNAMVSNTIGSGNVAVGNNTLFFITNKIDNVAIGNNSLRNSQGNSNTGVGANSMLSSTSAAGNTAVGKLSLDNNLDGDFNVGVGNLAGSTIIGGVIPNEHSLKSIYIGYDSHSLETTTTNEIVIGSLANGNGSNTFTLGNADITAVYTDGTFRSSNASPLWSNTATIGQVLTADGAGNSSWENAGGSVPTLQQVTTAGATTDVFTVFSKGVSSGSDFDEETAFGYMFGTPSNSGVKNTKLGAQAGWAIFGGAQATNFSNSLYVGYDTRASANGVTNENVFGYSATGSGSNTFTIGNPSITDNYFSGDIHASGFSASGSTGVSGTFTTVDAKTVTVTNGIITNIV